MLNSALVAEFFFFLYSRAVPFLKKYSQYYPWIFIGALVVLVFCLWAVVYSQTPQGKLVVAVMDVGQGDSIYIESPTGVQVVIDGGPDNSILRDLPKVMHPFDRSIDVLIETHPHADHIQGFIDLLHRYSIGAFIEPGVVYGGQDVDTLEKEILDEHIPRFIARRGTVLTLGGGAELDILYPDQDVTHLPEPKVHEGTVVARLVYGQTSVLLMGDAPQDVEDKLLLAEGTSTLTELKSDILKVGHHGSKTSSGQKFLEVVRPKEALISVGAHNKYGHPTQDALDRLASVGAEVLRTDQVGTITFESDGKSFKRVQ